MKNIAVVIGHSPDSPGKFSELIHQSEYFYNKEVAGYLLNVDVYKRPEGGGYKTQMRKLGGLVRPKKYDLIIDLHFNAFDNIDNGVGHGVETISYPGNEKTQAWGKEYCRRISNHFCNNNRGAKTATEGGRGWWFLHYMPTNAIILEPFFGDESESLGFTNEAEYAGIIMEWLESISIKPIT